MSRAITKLLHKVQRTVILRQYGPFNGPVNPSGGQRELSSFVRTFLRLDRFALPRDDLARDAASEFPAALAPTGSTSGERDKEKKREREKERRDKNRVSEHRRG